MSSANLAQTFKPKTHAELLRELARQVERLTPEHNDPEQFLIRKLSAARDMRRLATALDNLQYV